MLKSTVEPECTGQFSSLFLDYIAQKDQLIPFYNVFPTLENFQELIQQKNMEGAQREVLAKALKDQYLDISCQEVTLANIDSLRDSKTFTVTTGHQLNLFTGPLYFIYKIVSTIRLAEQLSQQYPDYHFVPVYWMATEDHDFEEINYFNYQGKKYQWNSLQTGAVGDFTIDEELKSLLKELSFAPDFFKTAYKNTKNLSTAVRHYVNHLFGEKGLLIVDGHDSALKRLFVPVIKEELSAPVANDLVQQQSEKLEALGYKSQIYPREINFFYLDKGLRSRILKTDEGFELVDNGQTFTKEQMLELVENEPWRFSPNVVLRPLYEEVILPNIAYLGGPAEVAYWLQLKTVFDHYRVQVPAIMPRNFAMILPKGTKHKISELGFEYPQLFESYESLKKAYVREHAQSDLDLEEEKKALAAIFERLAQKGAPIDPTLKNSAEAAKVRAGKVLDHYAVKLRKGEEKHMDIALQRIQDVKKVLFPGGTAQERKVNFLEFYLADSSFIDKLYPHFDPLEFTYIILHEDEG
ncbi:putative cysteine ligase BshC [Echinicola pacifica]|uniref:Putative cysteine ligase BshC n=1 Tax=Echinicola pacifica TaxID=346377 RepID=A0A918Q6F4_9BACT|nr:bacillithiol biosynthesis cysteine-adding enzyme BshC [Echinicola pacifica]GGZ35504.1 putative cysteine ligase BshC [Echinicola pacifica]